MDTDADNLHSSDEEPDPILSGLKPEEDEEEHNGYIEFIDVGGNRASSTTFGKR